MEVQLIHDVVVISAAQQGDSGTHTHTHTHTFFFIFFSIIVFHRTLNLVPCAIQ